MRYSVFFIFFIIFSCNKSKDSVFLNYQRKGDFLYTHYQNNTNYDAIFLVPKNLQFGDLNYNTNSTIGTREEDYPLTVLAKIVKNQQNSFYQHKLDSIFSAYLSQMNLDFKGEGEDMVIYLKRGEKIAIKYRLFIEKNFGKNYRSKFKQNYPSYDRVIKGSYADSEYLQRFSKLNFGKAKFVAQPVIEDSLFLRLSEKDVND